MSEHEPRYDVVWPLGKSHWDKRDLNPGIESRRAVAVSNRDYRLHSRLSSSSDHLLAIRVELFAVEMCVRIYEHGCWSLADMY